MKYELLSFCRMGICILAFQLSNLCAQDTIPPVITFNPGGNGCIELDCYNSPYTDPGATALDNIDGDVTTSITVTGFVNTRRIGTYFITYHAGDKAGNKAQKTRTVCVAHTKRPIGFTVIKNASEFLFATGRFSPTIYSFQWYIDGKHLGGYDDLDTLHYFFDDTLSHTICKNENFCNDTIIPFCVNIKGLPVNGISGILYLDKQTNCIMDTTDTRLSNIAVKLYDSANNLLEKVYSTSNGYYHFSDSTGKFRIEIDTLFMPIQVQCPYPGIDTSIVLNSGKPMANNINFGFNVKQSFDIGIKGCAYSNALVPGRTFTLYSSIGNLSQWHGFNWGSGISGTVTISVKGNITYTGLPLFALTPDKINNDTVFTYNISNFDSLKFYFGHSLSLNFKIDSTARLGDTVMVNIAVTPSSGDFNPSNNTGSYHFIVSNSYDPNAKEVYPVDVPPRYADWLTYTVHFQNTGSSSAYNINVRDTLDEKLDMETFEFMDASHAVQTSMKGHTVKFYFKDIMLPDSNSDEPNSHGHVQYRVKPIVNLKEGAKIFNTAGIYFDFNKPVFTNTTVNTFKTVVLGRVSAASFTGPFILYPNPFNETLTIETKLQNFEVELMDVTGKLIAVDVDNNTIHTGTLGSGLYFIRLIQNGKALYQGKVVKY